MLEEKVISIDQKGRESKRGAWVGASASYMLSDLYPIANHFNRYFIISTFILLFFASATAV